MLIVDYEILRWEVSKIHMLFILIATHCISVICGKVNYSMQVSLLLVRTFYRRDLHISSLLLYIYIYMLNKNTLGVKKVRG